MFSATPLASTRPTIATPLNEREWVTCPHGAGIYIGMHASQAEKVYLVVQSDGQVASRSYAEGAEFVPAVPPCSMEDVGGWFRIETPKGGWRFRVFAGRSTLEFQMENPHFHGGPVPFWNLRAGTVFRWEGQEFVKILPGEARPKLQDGTVGPTQVFHHEDRVTACGVALVLRRADGVDVTLEEWKVQEIFRSSCLRENAFTDILWRPLAERHRAAAELLGMTEDAFAEMILGPREGWPTPVIRTRAEWTEIRRALRDAGREDLVELLW